jgi:hypothetical protein
MSEEEAATLLMLTAGLHTPGSDALSPLFDSLSSSSITAMHDIARECGFLPLTLTGKVLAVAFVFVPIF